MDRSQQNLTTAPLRSEPWTWLLFAVLAGSAVLRIWLVLGGGRLFWTGLSRAPLAGATGLIPGLVCAAFSVVNIFLVWRIARTAGAAPREALLAALLQAGANTHFYYARHLLPYDAALTFGLLSLLTGWTGDGWRRSSGCGLLAAFALLIYRGYWFFGAVVLIGHVLRGGFDWPRAAGRAVPAGVGLLLPLVLVFGLTGWRDGEFFLASFQGSFLASEPGGIGRGWRLLSGYFWAAEGLNMVVGLLGLLFVAAGALAARRWHYGMRWVAGALGLAAGLLAWSRLRPDFVIHGRLARQLVPLVCLAAAFALERLWRAGGALRRVAAGIIILGLAQAAVNFSRPLQQSFPREFSGLAERVAGQLKAKGETRPLVVIHADDLPHLPGHADPLPDHDVILSAGHPLRYAPYQFEGFTDEQRRFLSTADIRMQLVAVNATPFYHPAALRQPWPGVVRLTLRLPQDKPGVHEPLLVTGTSGAGDLIFVVYDSPAGIRLGFDHWGYAGLLSDPIPVAYNKPVLVTLSLGGLQDQRPAGSKNPAADLRHWLYAEVNGQVIWSRAAEFHPALPASISFGWNPIGGSTCVSRFTGTMIKVESLLLPPEMGTQTLARQR